MSMDIYHPRIDSKIQEACDSFNRKCIISSYTELYKCGIISRDELIERTSQFIAFTPMKEVDIRNFHTSFNEDNK